MAAHKKRALEDASVNPKSKKTKTESAASKDKGADVHASTSSNVVVGEVDFPRGGGTSFTPLEVKAIRAEAAKEANDELFTDKTEKRKKRKSAVPASGKKAAKGEKGDAIRVEHLNYKRVAPGMKVLGQIVSIQPLALIISLPNQLFAHVPITEISSQLTSMLEAMDEDDASSSSDGEDAAEGVPKPRVPELFQVFRVGQYTLTAAVKSKEDHGYILDLGISDVSGFLSFKDAAKGPFDEPKNLHIGGLLDVAVTKTSGNGRTCNVTADSATCSTSSLTEVTSVTSILPGTLVQSLITAVVPDGLNLQVLGYFGGTVDQYHLAPGDPEQNYKVGQKVKARILYDINPSSPPRFALSLAEHLILMAPKSVAGSSLPDVYPIGTMLDAVKVIRVETARGLVVEASDDVEGHVHISQVSDDHVPSLSASSGHWKIGTVHKARVTGYFPLDGYLQLSFRQSVLQQKFLQVGEVQVGEVIKGTVKKLTDSALFVSISGTVDGVIWPNHYADIPLKHPQKRFKPGGTIKCRVLVVDPERRRIVLTAKKTLIDSTLPIVSGLEDAREGPITHAVVFKASDKSVQVEFYNNLKAIVPAREASETAVGSLSEAFPVGKPVKVKILSVDNESSRILASIRQAAPNFKAAITDISGVEIGDSVEGVVAEIQKEKVVVILQPTQVRALLSLNNLANKRGVSAAQLRASLKVEEKLQELVVVSRNPDKGIVLVATKPKEKDVLLHKSSLSLDTIQGALVKLTNTISGTLHPTDVSDDYGSGAPFPPVDAILKAVVLAVDKEKRQLTLSTRPSRMHPDQDKTVVDKEIKDLNNLKVGDTVRGFVKNVADHGLFVMLGRNIDARVQIKELFDQYVKEWKNHFSANQLVKGRILSINREKKQVEMSFRSGDLQRDMRPSVTLADLAEGQKVDGRVKKIEDYGIFVEIEGSKVSGLCHKSELSDNKDADVTLALRSFREGDHVKAVILSIDTEKRRISFGLKPSYFAESDFEMSGSEEDAQEDGADDALGVVDDEDAEMHALDVAHLDQSASDEDDSDDESQSDADLGVMDVDMNIDADDRRRSSQAKTGTSNALSLSLDLKEGFQWTTSQDLESDVGMSSSDDDEDDGQERKKKRRKRKEIEQDLTADMHTKVPESNSDFERVLLGSPNSSYLWIQYMSFQLQISEVDKAREIAKRALRTINFREEQEKLNVWTALLNLENVYGTDESLEAAFKDAARHNDSKTIHLRMAAIFDQSGKSEASTCKAEEMYKRTCKKFGQSSKVWTLFGEHYLKRGKLEEARKLLPRSLQSLEKRKHLKTISKFAQLEYKFGDPERGKTVFEGIVDSHPKRWDLWSVYIDMEAGQGDIMSVRNILDRVLSLKMTSHKAKAFFKKWLELERRIGDEEGANAVKAKAIEWTQRAAGSS
ncbi:hypothetical protein EVJ58_g3608 [Rhodofomes roseus]|uniref:S1 motif domain-containing protein n=1 Tax=Rhodofomes roseus TaxID=34475 RepID=A0A4Y9YP97_9APHY|nr:hypothetical protein EVJ58_g3608 [Rhodofomes roseus]